jgi:hypothetical protein
MKYEQTIENYRLKYSDPFGQCMNGVRVIKAINTPCGELAGILELCESPNDKQTNSPERSEYTATNTDQ